MDRDINPNNTSLKQMHNMTVVKVKWKEPCVLYLENTCDQFAIHISGKQVEAVLHHNVW